MVQSKTQTMKKIITLSIVCLVSGQLFAQAGKAQTTEAKSKIEAQKQKEVSSMSLQQAVDANALPGIATAAVAPATPALKQNAVVTPAAKQNVVVTPAAKASVTPKADALQAENAVEAAKAVPVLKEK